MFAIYSLGVKHYAVITDAFILLMTGVFLHAALPLFAALPLEPIADAIECVGMGGQRIWENTTV
jgi:hypothetical protein